MANIHIETQVLKKAKNNQPQSSLNKEQRRENVKNVYQLKKQEEIKKKYNVNKVVLF